MNQKEAVRLAQGLLAAAGGNASEFDGMDPLPASQELMCRNEVCFDRLALVPDER